MKIELIEETDREDYVRHELRINEKYYHSIGALCECPEDAIIGRSLVDGNDLIAAIKLGYDAAKNGEILDISITNKGR